MKRLLLILILTLSFQSWTKADDISDFEIEGMSIGDSLLDYFNEDLIKEEMNSSTVFIYKDNKFIDIGVGSTNAYPLKKNLEVYGDVGITLKPNDKKYKIYAIDGRLMCNLKVCLSQKKEIKSELISFFGKNATYSDLNSSHDYDKTGNSLTYMTTFKFKSHKSVVRVIAVDWSDEITNNFQWNDNLKVEIISSELLDFLQIGLYD